MQGHKPPTLQDLQNTKNKLIVTLIIINGGILILAGGAGYILAGETLKPIKKMVEEQDEFISNASHELRTPIATMRAEMEGQLLEKQITQNDHKQLIKSNLEEVQTLQELTDSLLSLAHVYDKRNNQKVTNVSMKTVLDEAKDRITQLAKEKKISFTIQDFDGKVQGNKHSLIEVFTILFDNAIKYSPHGSTISVTLEKSNKFMKVAVADQGIGISTQDLPHIFERFYRADKSRSQGKGYGLGLAIAKKIIENHHGAITVKSAEEKGTTFVVTLPLNKV